MSEPRDLGTCPYYRRFNGDRSFKDATCAFACVDEPRCVTDQPRDGWPSMGAVALDGWELTAAIARVLGCDPQHDSQVGGYMCYCVGGKHRDRDSVQGYLPRYHASVDALRNGPEQVLHASGWFLTVVGPDGSPNWGAEWRAWPFDHEGERLQYRALGGTETVARAQAALAALLKMTGGDGGEQRTPAERSRAALAGNDPAVLHPDVSTGEVRE